MTVTAGAIVVPVKGADRYLYRGTVVPEGVAASDLKRLKSIGLITEVKAATRPVATAPKQDDTSADETGADETGADETGADAAGEGAENSAPETPAENSKAQSRSKK
ncbi:hypothetical protein [Brevibacterium aurantiacum]|uniref:hypothetical protein n=1 Tax=Brevibacterium aurantiacum TaxID=273384 RepID=UPI003F8DDFE5